MKLDRIMALLELLKAEIADTSYVDMPGETATLRSTVAILKHISARTRWNATGVRVAIGDRVDIWADSDYVNVWQVGEHLRCGPEGDSQYPARVGYILPGHPEGCLVARIGNTTFFVGREAVLQSPTEGELFLAVNDDSTEGCGAANTDNKGVIAVRIALTEMTVDTVEPVEISS